MENRQENSGYQFEDLIRVVKRENNTRRSFLFLNRAQAKYIPSDPEETLRLFSTLGRKAASGNCHGPAVVIGFAETATAVGMSVALAMGEDSFYIHTTRETLTDAGPAVFFEEEHSHAPGHFLYCRDWQRLREAGTIVFADDEFTTGRTICNFADALRAKGLVGDQTDLMAASLVNCMSDRDLDHFSDRGIDWTYLMREKGSWEHIRWQGEPRPDVMGGRPSHPYRQTAIPGNPGIRTGIESSVYERACLELGACLLDREIIRPSGRRVLLLGTEEFMYPVIRAGAWLKEKCPGMDVRVHAVSRSPIVPLDGPGYPVVNRSRLPSLYDDRRQVFLYNLARYDQVLMITDVANLKESSVQTYVSVLEQFGNEDITVVQWSRTGEDA